MADTSTDNSKVRIYLCECGPIIKDAIDLDRISQGLGADTGVDRVAKYSTLCSVEGRQWLREELEKDPDCRVVIAGCSPREHGATFMDVCRQAEFNPYLLTMANIREQCIWVTLDRYQAEEKALRMIRAASSRVVEQQPLEESEIDCSTDVLVVGSGVAGLNAARMLAEGGRRVTIIEREPAVGGRAAMLSEIYPNLECGSCMLEPLLDDVLHHPNIECLTDSEVEEVLGFFGNFTARIRKSARRVDVGSCYGCRTCVEACPVEMPSASDCGLSTRKAIDTAYAGALPNATAVDGENCVHAQGGQCTRCADACPFGAIDLDAADETVERKVGAVIVATGAETEPLDRTGGSTGRVLTAMAFERLLNASGPTGGELRLPGSDGPRSVALVHCSDGLGRAPVERCSKICCMAFAKYAHMIGQKLPECTVHEFLWDRCAGGKGFREFCSETATQTGLRQEWFRPGDRIESVSEGDSGVTIRYTRDGRTGEVAVDLAVLSPPLRGSRGTEELGSVLRIEREKHGYFVEAHGHLRSSHSRVEGIYLAGCAQAPRTIEESASHGAAAAGSVLAALVPGRKLAVDPATAAVDGDRCGACHTCVTVCPFGAATFDDTERTASVNKVLCRGCGTCGASCPTAAIRVHHFADEQIRAEIGALCRGDKTASDRGAGFESCQNEDSTSPQTGDVVMR